jgi:transcriptional repressor NrdR
MLLASRKRPIDLETLRDASERVERDLFQEYDEEVTSRAIGQRVLQELHQIDTVAYIRFASVYQEFETIADFERMVSDITSNAPTPLTGLVAL